MSLLSYQHELKDAQEFHEAAPRAHVSAAELKMAKLLTQAMSIENPDLGEYRGSYASITQGDRDFGRRSFTKGPKSRARESSKVPRRTSHIASSTSWMRLRRA